MTAKEIYEEAQFLLNGTDRDQPLEFEISSNLVYKIICDGKAFARRDEQLLLFGIPVRINVNKQNVIKLWKEVY